MSEVETPELSPAASAGLSLLATHARETDLANTFHARNPSSPAGIQVYAALIWVRNLELQAAAQTPSGGAGMLPLGVRFGLHALARRVNIDVLADHLALQGASAAEVDAVTEALSWLMLAELPALAESEGV